MAATILTVDDDVPFQEMLHLFLTAEGFHVIQAFNGEQCMAQLHNNQPDLIVLDIQMPDTDGITLCRNIRSIYPLPILFLTGNKLQSDKLISLQAGGDDYLTKPFDQLELVARVKSHMRWGALLTATKQAGNKLTFPGLEIDLDRKTVIANGEPVTLLAKELHLLITLAQNPQRVYHPRQLHELIWDDLNNGYSSDLIKVHIHNLRKKLEIDPANPRYIQTVRGFGYKFDYAR
ncbi:response regulator transcription factor [Paenibacillus thalictri]|uniref:Response regulator transcription factor n=1 Tax=Paenibacillus thalictri TaxID=2527873 RepID=A0A4V2J4J8_9BACL|nr:response regulator transcription factor [Paenibacillus thalictri]TBL80101.1 response regulator transcription factor [Paenibacillus thalictri]